MGSKGTFSDKMGKILGNGKEDVATITLARSPDGGSVIVRVALSTDEHGVLRKIKEIPADKFTPGRLLSAAEEAYNTIAGAVGIIEARTPGFDDA